MTYAPSGKEAAWSGKGLYILRNELDLILEITIDNLLDPLPTESELPAPRHDCHDINAEEDVSIRFLLVNPESLQA